MNYDDADALVPEKKILACILDLLYGMHGRTIEPRTHRFINDHDTNVWLTLGADNPLDYDDSIMEHMRNLPLWSEK